MVLGNDRLHMRLVQRQHITILRMLPVKHASQDLCGHDDASGIWSNGDITRHQAHIIIKLIAQLPELLITQSLHCHVGDCLHTHSC